MRLGREGCAVEGGLVCFGKNLVAWEFGKDGELSDSCSYFRWSRQEVKL